MTAVDEKQRELNELMNRLARIGQDQRELLHPYGTMPSPEGKRHLVNGFLNYESKLVDKGFERQKALHNFISSNRRN